MSFLRAILITDPLVVLATIIYGAAAFAVSFFDPSGDRQIRVARAWGRAICFITRIQITVEGLDKIQPGTHYIFTPNHLSYTDTPVLLSSIPANFRFMAKRGLFQIPFLGTHLQRAGHIPVALEDPRASIRALTQAARIINERRISVLIFPEGGRSENGELQEFKDGAAYTAIKSGVPIIPVALCGTRAILPMHSLHVRGGKVTVRIGDPIQTAGLKLHNRAALTAQIRAQIVAMLESEPAAIASGR
jgi:1-acyl-sn-glycerol-3-phosphate acyltransferase